MRLKHCISFVSGKRGCRRVADSGFTLVELLVVITIILILTALLVPAVKNLLGGVNVTAAAEEISGTIALARQRASSSSRNVSMRFFRTDNTTPNAPFKSYQIWEQEVDPANPFLFVWNPFDKEQPLATGLIVSSNTKFSAILSFSFEPSTSTRKYAEFFFTPSGGVAVSKDYACLTIHSETAPKTGGLVTDLPPNFATVNIEPFNGRVNIIRP